jgi:hypothetical protein
MGCELRTEIEILSFERCDWFAITRDNRLLTDLLSRSTQSMKLLKRLVGSLFGRRVVGGRHQEHSTFSKDRVAISMQKDVKMLRFHFLAISLLELSREPLCTK